MKIADLILRSRSFNSVHYQPSFDTLLFLCSSDSNMIKERKRLEQKVQDLEEQFLCGICMERKRNVAFLCGHGACTHCTQGCVNLKNEFAFSLSCCLSFYPYLWCMSVFISILDSFLGLYTFSIPYLA